jgi:hypothetical protein
MIVMTISKKFKVVSRKRASQGRAFKNIKKGDVFDVSVDFNAYQYGYAPKVNVIKSIGSCKGCPVNKSCNTKSTTMGHFNRSAKLFELEEIKKQ